MSFTPDDAQHAAELLELGDAFFELDADWRIVRVNRRQEALSRKPRTETLGRRFAEVWPELATPESRYWREYHRCMDERVPIQFEEYYAPLDLWTGVTAYPISTGGMAVFFRDLTTVKHAEREQRRLASIVEDTDDAIIAKNLDGTIQTWNAGAERLFGYAADEVVGRAIDLLLPEDRPDEEDRILAELRAGHRVAHFETTRVRKDGSLVEVSVTVSPLRDDDGTVVGASKIARDITARKRAEHALRDSEERFRSVVENLSEGLMLFDAQGNLTYQNPASLRIHGFAARADGRIAHDTLPVTWNAWDLEGRPIGFDGWPVSRVIRGERFQDQVMRVQRVETGRVFYGSYNGSPILDADGKIGLGFITIRDITDRISAQAELRESEAQFRSIFEQAAVGMARVRFPDARWIDVNEAFCRMLGRSRQEMLSTAWTQMTHPEDLDLDLVPFRRMAAGDLDSYTLEKRFIHARGHEVWARLTLSLVRDARGRPEYEVAIVEDIGDRKRAEESLRDANERLREADRRKDEFLGMLSHELRNPLAPIRNSLYILERADPTGQQARRATDVANRQVTHLTRLVDDLLDVTRVARGKIELRRAKLDVGALARRTADDHRPLMRERGLELDVAVPDAPVVVDGDDTRLAQVFGNLLSNAAKFTPGGGRVTLAVERSGGRAVVHVRDTGLGIEPDLLPTIFDPFTQAKQTLARSEGGLGLGLALVKGLTELHGGRVLATSTPGVGTEFTVELPLAGPADAPERDDAPRAAGRAYRVLVVDDNADAADSLAELVRLFGHEVDVAYDGPSAVASVEANRPDVVLCDIGLPGMNGYEVAQALRARLDRTVQLVAVSGYAQPEDVRRSAEAGFDDHIAKPPDPARIEGLFA